MKHAALPLAIGSLLTVAAPARAVMESPHGFGQVLFYPYYSVNKGQDTLIALTNTDLAHAKVARVRVKEGMNARAVADVDVFLAPGDVWTAVITEASAAGGALIRTSDPSCTMPAIPPGGLALSSAGYDGTIGGIPADDGPAGISRTREGYVEVIASADFSFGTPTYAAVTPPEDVDPGTGVPPDCAALSATQIETDAVTPSATLFGTGAVIDVGSGIYYAYEADALADFTSTPLYGTDGSPQLDQANTVGSIGVRADVAIQSGRVVAADFDTGIDAVSAALMRSSITNEWLADPSLGALTDWVLTFPTKSFYVDKLLYPANPTNPFAEPFHDGGSIVSMSTFVLDRAGGRTPTVSCPGGTPNCYPGIPYAPFAVTVFSFRPVAVGASEPPSDVFGSSLVGPTLAGPDGGFIPWGTAGWAVADLATGDGGHALSLGTEESAGGFVDLQGLPTIGFMAYNIVNAAANPGLLANYGATFKHRGSGVTCNPCGGEDAHR